MTTLHLGVVDHNYTNSEKSISTGDVAEILEDHYGVLTGFSVTNTQQIADVLADSYAGALETIVMGGVSNDPAASGMSKISTMMKQYLTTREAEWVLAPGVKGHPVPTLAALKGVRTRYKDPTSILKKVLKGKKTKVGVRRPSFIDTGLYENSLIAWMD